MSRVAVVLLVTAALGLVSCGGGPHSGGPSGEGSSGARRSTGSTAPASAAGPYRWLIPIAGPQPTVAEENRHQGGTDWRLPGPSVQIGGEAWGNVRGYPSADAVRPGETERLYVDAPGAPALRIAVFRMGWYGGTGARQVLSSARLPVPRQPRCTHRSATGLTECDWHPVLSFTVPPGLPSGVYVAKLSARTGQSDLLFVVRASRPQPLLAQLPTSTYQAYNAWGGDSLYPGGADRVGLTGTTQGIEVSDQRPYDSITGAGQFFARDVAMIRFLERYGYPVSYTTSSSVDAEPAQLAGHRALIDFGHSEYWSQRQYDAWRGARDHGTSLLFFGSDTMAWRIRYAPASAAASQAGAAAHSIVAYKEHASLDPEHGGPTGAFPGGGASLTGAAYRGCITPRLPVSGPPTYRYYAWSPSPTLSPRWLFAGTGLRSGSTIGGIVGYELDLRTAASPSSTMVVGGGEASCMPVGDLGEPVPGAGEHRAQSTLYTAPSGATVFDTGTLGWELGLEPVPSASPDVPTATDARVVALTRNLLAHVL